MSTAEKNIHLLLGPEIGQKQKHITQLFEKAKSIDASIEKYKFYPYDGGVTQIINIIETPGLFESSRFLEIANIEDFKTPDMDKLLEVCTHMGSEVWVVFSSIQTQTNKINKKLDSIIPAKNRKIFWEMFENRKHEWIRDFFKDEGIKVSEDAIDRLLILVENNTQELSVVCEALSGFFEVKGSITEDDVASFVIHTREESVYSLFSYIVSADLNLACDCLNSLSTKTDGTSVQIAAGLLWQFRKLFRVKELLSQGHSFEAAAKQAMVLGKHQTDLYSKACKKYSLKNLQSLLKEFTVYDSLLRSNYPKQMQKILVESLLTQLVSPSSMPRNYYRF